MGTSQVMCLLNQIVLVIRQGCSQEEEESLSFGVKRGIV